MMTAELLFENFETLADAPNGILKLREMILQLAMQGKLVAQDPNEPSASELLEKIWCHKDRLITGKQIKKSDTYPRIEPDNYPYELPKGWCWCWLGEIANSIQDGTHFSPKEQFPDRDANRYLYITSLSAYIDETKFCIIG